MSGAKKSVGQLPIGIDSAVTLYAERTEDVESAGTEKSTGKGAGKVQKSAAVKPMSVSFSGSIASTAAKVDASEKAEPVDPFAICKEGKPTAPMELILEFLTALMTYKYKEALELSNAILKFEPDNKTVLEFQPLLQEILAAGDNDSDSDCTCSDESEMDSGSGSEAGSFETISDNSDSDGEQGGGSETSDQGYNS